MRTDETICLNSIVDGKQPPVADRIYWGGAVNPALTSGWKNYILYEENDDPYAGTKRGRKAAPAPVR